MKQTRAFFNRFSIGVTALWLLLFALLPNIGLLVVTVLTRGEQDFVLPQFTLDNYLRLLDPTFLKILWESLWLAFMSTLACLLVGYPFAYRIARASAKMKPWLLLLVIIPFWTNSLIRTYALILILKANGLISTLLVWLGVTEQPVSFMYGDFAVFMGILYTFLPFMVLPLYASIEKLDSRLLDAARDLGASGFQSFWHVTFPLTLPGIAGIVLTIGMAVDANVLIYERIREELHLGLSPLAAVKAGFERATISITDSNLTTIIATVILYQFGTGPIRGFAVTLSLGIVASMFTAIFVSRAIFEYWARKCGPKGISI